MKVSNKVLFITGAGLIVLTGLVLSACNRLQTDAANGINNQKSSSSFAEKSKTLTIVFPNRGDSTDLQTKANGVAAFLSKELGMEVKAQVGDDTAAVEALRANRADVAFLSSRPALKAEQLANARLYLAEIRSSYSGGYTYNSVFVVPNQSNLKTQSSPQATLEQLRGKRIAFTSPTSGSGFIFPVSELVKQKFVENRDRLDGFFGQVSYGGNYSKALQAVLRNQADVAVVSEYSLSSPYITPAEKSQLRVLHKISGVPAHGIAIDDDVPAPTKEKIINAFLQLNQSENNSILRNLYNSTGLVKVDHNSHLSPIREALQTIGLQP